MEADDGTGAFHYNATVDSVISSHTDGLPAGAQGSQMIHQGYDTASGQQVTDQRSDMYSLKRNDQMQGDLYGLSSDQTMQNDFAPNTAETAEMYQQQGNVRHNEEYMTNDPNMEAYMMEHDPNQYDVYDSSQYPEEQYVNGNQFDVTTNQMENNQIASDIARNSTEILH